MSYDDEVRGMEVSEAWDEGYQSGLDAGEEERDELQARLDAVRARIPAIKDWIREDGDIPEGSIEFSFREIDAALSAAPQPEPDDEATLNAGGRSPEAFVFEPKRPRHPEPPASDEPARCEHGKTKAHWLDDWGVGLGAVRCPGPAASGTPDGGT